MTMTALNPSSPPVEERSTANLTIMLDQPDAMHLAVSLSGAGPVVGPVVVPYDAALLEQLGAQLSTTPTLPRDQQQTLGVTLGDLLLPPALIRPAFQVLWRDVATHNGSLRLRLQCSLPVLAVPPWEYLQVPLLPDGPPLALLGDPRISFVRVGGDPQDIVLPVTDDHLPLDVLLVLAEPPDQPPLKLQQEEQRVEAGLQQLPAGALIQLPVLKQARWPDLQTALAGDRHVDLLHFAGHGYFSGGSTGLIFHDDEDPNTSHLVTADDLAAEFHGKGVKVVVLSACESARVDRGVWNGVAQQLLAAGVPAVVAMQFPVGDDEARAFAAGFYTALATGSTVDVAVAEGRLRMAGSVPLTTGWGCPVIYMRTTEARLFHYSTPLTAALEQAQAALVVNQAIKHIAGSVIGLDLGTVVVENGQLVVNQQIDAVEQSGTVVGLRVVNLDLHSDGKNGGADGHTNGSVPDSAATMPPPRPADPVAAAHLEPVEAALTPTVTTASVATTTAAALPANLMATSPAVQTLFAETSNFVERPTIEREINEFLTVRNRMLVIVGPPGSGKTALGAWRVAQSATTAYPWLYHFCGVDDGDNPQDFIQQLANQIKTLLPNYTVAAPSATGTTTLILQSNVQVATNRGNVEGIHTGDINLGEVHPREAFRRLIQQPLKDYRRELGPDNQPVPLAIMVDALDRAWEWDGGQSGNIVTLLSEVQDMPPWVNFICTARPGAAVQTLRTHGGVRVLNLGQDVVTTINDITHYLSVEWNERLQAGARTKLNMLLQATEPYASLTTDNRLPALMTNVAAATEGSFLYARRFVDTLHSALGSTGSPEGIDPATLLQHPEQLDAALVSAYSDVLVQLHHNLDAVPDATDEAVLAGLAITFAPLSEHLLALLTGCAQTAVHTSLERLNSVLAPPSMTQPALYALYSRSFADYLRTTLPETGRVWDRGLAEVLEAQADNGDSEMSSYRAHYRWRHLQRGLQLGITTAPAGTAAGVRVVPLLTDLQQLEDQVPDPLLRARVLRAQALALLDPGTMRPNAWTTAVALLKSAEAGIMRARALAPLRRGRRLYFTDRQRSPQTEVALEELERTLLAQGDAYTIIAEQLLGTDEMRPIPHGGPLRSLVVLWGMLLRLPALLYSAIPLLRSGLTLKDLALGCPWLCRGRDWSVVRLLVRSLRSYTRAVVIADRRGDTASVEELHDRIGQIYVRCDALYGAATAFNDLLASTSTIDRPWQEALWRLRLGEVLARLGQSGRAAPLLEAALRQFMAQDAPMPQARTCNALVYTYVHQAQLLRLHGDEQGAANYEDLALRRAEDGVVAWNHLSTLEGDDVTQVDPAAGRSRLLGTVWSLRQTNVLAEEQQLRADGLLDRSIERHFPQRFEHPLLYWFQAAAIVVNPLLLLVGLLWAIQLPSTLEFVPARTKTILQPPLVDLRGFPDNLVGTHSSVKGVQALTLVQSTASDSGEIILKTGSPLVYASTTLLAIGRGIVIAILLYTLGGLLFILISEPNKFQSYRPGRLILRAEMIIWRGTPISGSRWRTWRTLFLRSLTSIQRRIGRGLLPNPTLPETSEPAEVQTERRLAYSDVKATLVTERRVNGLVVYDLSERVLLPETPTAPALVIDGSVARYDELVGELAHRIVAPQQRLAGDLVRSVAGSLFVLTIIGIGLFLALITFYPTVMLLRPGNGPVHLTELYILATPGLLLPLCWVFVWQPLASLTVRYVSRSCALLAVAIALAISAALFWGVDLSRVGLNPDLLLPLLAIALALTALGLLRLRHHYATRETVQDRASTRLLALLALVPLLFCMYHVWNDGLWYRNLILGNRALELAGGDPSCKDFQCPALQEADRRYARMIELRGADPEGYGARGFTALRAGATIGAAGYFEQAQNQLPRFYGAARRNLAASLGEVYARQAQGGAGITPATAFSAALYSYRSAVLPQVARTVDTFPVPRGFAQCFATSTSNAPPLEVLRLNSGDTQYALQYADIWYNRAVQQLTAFEHPNVPVTNYYVSNPLTASEKVSDTAGVSRPFDCRPIRAWEDLGTAIRLYTAIADAPASNTQAHYDSLMGLAAAWLERGNVPVTIRPVDAPGAHASYMEAQAAYRRATLVQPADPEANAGVAWTAMLLDAWDQAQYPLLQAHLNAPQDPRYPTFSGLAWWLQGEQIPAAPSGALRAGYQRLLLHAVEQYTIALTQTELIQQTKALKSTTPTRGTLGQYYATRSILYYNLRKTPALNNVSSAVDDIARSDHEATVGYRDMVDLPGCLTENYDIWIQRAIRDMDQAIDAATIEQRGSPTPQQPLPELVAYHYWRGRLHMALALTWQGHSCGSHPWRTILPEYSAAVDDFTAGTETDPDPKRAQSYGTEWLNWSQYLAHNAARLALAEAAIAQALDHPADSAAAYERAREELQAVDVADPTANDSGPQPDYFLLSGFVALATGQPIMNTHTRNSVPLTAAQAYEQTIHDVANLPKSVRTALYTDLLQSLNRLLATTGLAESVRHNVWSIQSCLGQAKVGRVDPDTISCVPK
ncbi:MAG: CHAT domain-containing protein [Herpetosiphonaceae bacterium]|nr:CHAT domain-containing protein [Herpetosiphonaceae bacterium]